MKFIKILLLTFFISLISSAKSEVIRVGKNQPHQSIVAALANCADDDTLFLEKGTYHEHDVVIEKSITLTGHPYAIIDGDKAGEILVVRADSVVIDGLQLHNVGVSYLKDMAAIRVDHVEYATIKNCTILNAFFGIYLAKSNFATILNNHLKGQANDEYNSGNAIHLWYCTNAFIKGNTVEYHRDGIYLEFVEDSWIVDNLSHDNLRYGLHFMFSNNDEYNHNTFINNGAGVAVMFSKFIEMCHNTFELNWGTASYGLLLKEIYDANVENNIFIKNTTAIHAEGATRTWFEHNLFKENGWAFNVGGSCMHNTIVHNNFVSNTFDIVGSSHRNHTTYNNNYWSDYSGYDLNKDRIGDIPHRPVKLFNYIIKRVPESIVLMRSPFVDLMSVAEKISPVFTPDNVIDHQPSTRKFNVSN
jgi:nitrous oxidase accessory protein